MLLALLRIVPKLESASPSIKNKYCKVTPTRTMSAVDIQTEPSTKEDPFEPYYFQHEEQKICGQLVSPITDNYDENYPSVVDRFFTRYYYIKGQVAYQVLYHSNRICLVCLAPSHPAYIEGVESVSFDVGNVDRSQNVVKGKAKKAA